jgi:hypothetical protein
MVMITPETRSGAARLDDGPPLDPRASSVVDRRAEPRLGAHLPLIIETGRTRRAGVLRDGCGRGLGADVLLPPVGPGLVRLLVRLPERGWHAVDAIPVREDPRPDGGAHLGLRLLGGRRRPRFVALDAGEAADVLPQGPVGEATGLEQLGGEVLEVRYLSPDGGPGPNLVRAIRRAEWAFGLARSALAGTGPCEGDAEMTIDEAVAILSRLQRYEARLMRSFESMPGHP